MSANQELIMLSGTIKETNPTRPKDVKVIIDDYFKSVNWSLLKQEFETLTPRQKRSLYEKLYRAYLKGKLPLTPGALHR